MYEEDTIAAIATPAGEGGVAVLGDRGCLRVVLLATAPRMVS